MRTLLTTIFMMVVSLPAFSQGFSYNSVQTEFSKIYAGVTSGCQTNNSWEAVVDCQQKLLSVDLSPLGYEAQPYTDFVDADGEKFLLIGIQFKAPGRAPYVRMVKVFEYTKSGSSVRSPRFQRAYMHVEYAKFEGADYLPLVAEYAKGKFAFVNQRYQQEVLKGAPDSAVAKAAKKELNPNAELGYYMANDEALLYSFEKLEYLVKNTKKLKKGEVRTRLPIKGF